MPPLPTANPDRSAEPSANPPALQYKAESGGLSWLPTQKRGLYLQCIHPIIPIIPSGFTAFFFIIQLRCLRLPIQPVEQTGARLFTAFFFCFLSQMSLSELPVTVTAHLKLFCLPDVFNVQLRTLHVELRRIIISAGSMRALRMRSLPFGGASHLVVFLQVYHLPQDGGDQEHAEPGVAALHPPC